MGTAVYSCVSLLVFLLARRLFRKSHVHLPPGPKPLPIIGNLLQFPDKEHSAVFAEWREQYGDVIYLNVLGKSTLILNSWKACNELLEKRSAIYSDRPRMVMLKELMNFSWNWGLMAYSVRWRQHRRAFHQYFNENASNNYRDIQERSTHLFLTQLLQKPDSLFEHIRLLFASTILEIVYDIKVKTIDNPFVEVAEKVMRIGAECAIPGRFLIEVLPFLKHVPSWLPGAGFQKFALEGKLAGEDLVEKPALYVERNMETSGAGSSVLSQLIEKIKGGGDNAATVDTNLQIAKNSMAVAYVAGADTTLSSLQALFMALANHPEVQKAAQAELDTVVGPHRLPLFSDQPDLPYICAIAKEVLRWHTVLPLGVPHTSTEDDVYEGYMVPRGTTVMPNIKLILRDPEVYPNPDIFNPSRWLIDTPNGLQINKAIPDPDAIFGFGRRTCPGRHLAHNALFITISNVLACFNISPLDDAGKAADMVPENFTDGFMTYPVPYKVSIQPRSDAVVQLLKEIQE